MRVPMHTLVAGNPLVVGVISRALSGRGIYPGFRACPNHLPLSRAYASVIL